MIRPEVCVGAIVLHGQHILLVKRANPPQQGKWSLPGGRVEFGESLTAAVAREVLEETGLVVRVDRFVEAIERIGEGHHFVILDYLAYPASEQTDIAASSDAADVCWIDCQQVPTLDLSNGLLEFLVSHGFVAPGLY